MTSGPSTDMNTPDQCLADLDHALTLIDLAVAAFTSAADQAAQTHRAHIASDLEVLADALRREGDAALDIFLRAIKPTPPPQA